MSIKLLAMLAASSFAAWQTHYELGEQFLAQGKTEAALHELTAARQEAEAGALGSPELGWILDALGRTEFRAGRHRSAKAYFERALRYRSNNPISEAAVLANLGQCLQALGERARAERSLRRAVDLAPESANAWHLLGSILFQNRQFAPAEAALRKAIQLSDHSDSAAATASASDLASLYRAQGQLGKAIAALEQALELAEPGQSRARMLANLGSFKWQAGAKRQAADYLQRALKEMESAVGPNHPDVAYILADYAVVLEKSDNKKEAREAASRAKAIQSSFSAQTRNTSVAVDVTDRK